MADEDLIVRSEGSLGWIVFNRPAKMNAITSDMWQAIPRALETLTNNPEVRVILFRGAGEKAFSAGADISEFHENATRSVKSSVKIGTTRSAFQAVADCAKPTLAMVHGVCYGGGCALCLNADIRIASTDATFAITPARLGLGYAFEDVERAVQELGPANARELLITARRIDAHRALEMGIVQQVCAPGVLEATARELASSIAENAPKTIRAIRESVRQSLLSPEQRNLDEVQQLIQECFDSDDYREGLEAFVERRKPRFEDK